MKKIIFLILFSIQLVTCDLFIEPYNPDYLDNLYNEIAWANAPRLTITVDYPLNWGHSPQRGTGNSGDARLGYAFGLEFTPNSSYGFSGWLAFRDDVYSKINIAEATFEEAALLSLNENEAKFDINTTHTGTVTANITINISDPVTLVPFCDTRLRVTRSNPPLTQTLNTVPFDQRVSLWFNMNIDPQTAILGQTIRIFKNDTDDVSDYFNLTLGENNTRIDLNVKTNDISYPSSYLQLSTIKVEIGTGIANLFGFEMSSVQVIIYNTNASVSQRVYKTNGVQARRTPAEAFFSNSGTQCYNPQIDRRFNKTNFNTAYLNFDVEAPLEAPAAPNRVMVVERLYADLNGNPITPPIDINGTAQIVSSPTININHTLQTDTSGIIQLVVLPWHEGTINRQEVDDAITSGCYVTVVMDLTAPVITGSVTDITGQTSTDNSVLIFGLNPLMTVSLARLGFLNDAGISAGSAWDKPWTRDDHDNISWKILIQGTAYDSGWLNVLDSSGNPNKHDINLNTDVSGLVIGNNYNVLIRFTDRMGNEVSAPNPAGIIRKIDTTVSPVTDLTAVCNADVNQITVSWRTPAVMTDLDVFVNGVRQNPVRLSENCSLNIPVPSINTFGITSGQSVSGVTRYDISIRAYNAAGSDTERRLTIWNIPDMRVTETNTVQLNNSNIMTALTANNTNNFVLTEDIILASWTPLSNFTGKFYGNGHTIQINNLGGTAADRGFFGTVNNAEIRDLRIEYGDFSISGSVSNFGGITGVADGNTRIRNVIVGRNNRNVSITSTTGINAGMITGSARSAVTIENCYAALNLNVSTSGGASFGGIAGLNSGTINDSIVSGSLRLSGSGGSDFNCGGIVGRMTAGKIYDCHLIGRIIHDPNYSVNGDTFVGGIVGRINNITSQVILEKSTASGDLSFTNNGNGSLSLGGVCGNAIGASSANNIRFIECEYRAGSIENIETEGNGWRMIGGFVGRISQFVLFRNCGSRASIIRHSSNSSTLITGGFIGRIEGGGNGSEFERCFSTSPVDISFNNLNGQTQIGGFMGEITQNTSGSPNTIKGCYAAGSVAVTVRAGGDGGSVRAGGFMGFSGEHNQFEDCYALGNVIVESLGTSQIYAGGFSGYASNSSTRYWRCFSAGMVSGRTLRSDTNVRLGGFKGRQFNSTQEDVYNNCVVLGSSVTARSPSTAGLVHRIFNGDNTGSTYAGNNNYAIDTMRIEIGGFNDWNIDPSALTSDVGHRLRHGETVSAGFLRNTSFWRDTLGYPENIWDFFTVASRGYPILRGVGGQ